MRNSESHRWHFTLRAWVFYRSCLQKSSCEKIFVNSKRKNSPEYINEVKNVVYNSGEFFRYLILNSIFNLGIWLLRIRLSGNMASWTKSAA